MKSTKKAVLFGFLVWLIVFLVGVFAFPLKVTNRPLFESIMPVAITLWTVLFALRYFARVDRRFLLEGILIGFIWLIINIGIDIPLFLVGGPMKMTPFEYVSDIAVAYLIIPIVTIGFGWLAGKKAKQRRDRSAAETAVQSPTDSVHPDGEAPEKGMTEKPPLSSNSTT